MPTSGFYCLIFVPVSVGCFCHLCCFSYAPVVVFCYLLSILPMSACRVILLAVLFTFHAQLSASCKFC